MESLDATLVSGNKRGASHIRTVLHHTSHLVQTWLSLSVACCVDRLHQILRTAVSRRALHET